MLLQVNSARQAVGGLAGNLVFFFLDFFVAVWSSSFGSMGKRINKTRGSFTQ